MIRTSPRRASLLGAIALLASFLSGGADRVVCVARGGHVALEPAHVASVCPTLARAGDQGVDALDAPERGCVDLALELGHDVPMLRTPSDANDRGDVSPIGVSSVSGVLRFASDVGPGAPPISIELDSPDRLSLGTVVLRI